MSDPNNLEGAPPTVEERAAMARELDAVAPTPADKFRLMLGQRPTPRTDAVNCEDGLLLESRYDKMHDLAEELERELAEARADAVSMSDSAKWLRRELRDAIIERDNAESDRRQAEADAIRALHERNEARGQRDRLAEELEDAEAALTALEGGTDE